MKQTRNENFRARMLDEAFRVVKKDGLKALSMRKLAAALSYSTIKLYSDCGGKPQLLELMAEEICKDQNACLAKVPGGGDPEDYLLRLTRAASEYYVERLWAAEILRTVRFEMHKAEQTPAFIEASAVYSRAVQALDYPSLRSEEGLGEALSVARALSLGALSMLHSESSSVERQKVIQIIDHGLKLIIAGWRAEAVA